MPAEEIKGKNFSDILKISLNRIHESRNSEVEEWKTKASKGNDEKVQALQTEKEKLAKDYNDLKEVNATTSREYMTFKEQVEQEKKSSKINGLFDKSYSAVKFKDGMTPIDHKGFKADLNDNYVFEVDEKDAFIVRDKQGKIVTSKKVAGQPATLDEILEMEADKNNLIKKNNTRTGASALDFGKKSEPIRRELNGSVPIFQGRIRKMNKGYGE